MTRSALSDSGITVPAQAIYMLQLRGYEIERLHAPNAGSARYRMRITRDSSEDKRSVEARDGVRLSKRTRTKTVIGEARLRSCLTFLHTKQFKESK